MLQLLKIEWLKIKSYPAFWWILGITAFSYVAASYAMVGFYHQLSNNPQMGKTTQMLLGNPFSFKEVWHTIAYISSLFIIIPSLVVIMLITNEYTFKTHRQNVIEGWSRRQFLTGKLLDIAVVSLLITLIYAGACLVIGFSNTTATDFTGNSKTYFIGYFFLQTFSQLSIAFVIGFLVRKSFMALGIFIFSIAILEPMLTWLFSKYDMVIGYFLPFEISDQMIPPPTFMAKMNPKAYELAMNSTGQYFFYTLVFSFILWLFCFRINAKRDL